MSTLPSLRSLLPGALVHGLEVGGLSLFVDKHGFVTRGALEPHGR
jgi:hypothetical protein